MSATYFGYATNPSDTGDLRDTSTPVGVTPPASMASGDLVAVEVTQRDPGVTLTNFEDGGQTWDALTAVASGSQTKRTFWCVFNGTWTADPTWTTNFTASLHFSVQMIVFRPSGTPTWAVDVAQTSGNATPGTPFDVTATGHTATASGVTICSFFNTSFDGEPFTLQSGGSGWANPSSIAQFRNRKASSSGNEQTISVAYKLNSGAGATGNCTNRMTQSITTLWTTLTFKDQSAATTTVTPGVGAVSAVGQVPAKVSSLGIAPEVGLAVLSALNPAVFDGPRPSAGGISIAGLTPTVVQTTPPSAALAPSVMVAAGQVPTLLRYRTIFPQINTSAGNGTDLIPTVIQGWLCQPTTGLARTGGQIPNTIRNGAGNVTPANLALLSLGGLTPSLALVNGNSTVLAPNRGNLEVSQLVPDLLRYRSTGVDMGLHQVVGLVPTLSQRIAWVDTGSPQDPVWRDV